MITWGLNILLGVVLCLTTSLSLAKVPSKNSQVDPLTLYSKVTALTMAFNSKYGKRFSLPDNAKSAIPSILKNSNSHRYMASKTDNTYQKNSKFAKDAQSMMQDLSSLLLQFKKIGFIHAIKAKGKTPAIMLDIDNTLELTSFADNYWSASSRNDPASVGFAEKNCFKDGIACYFITARTCNQKEASQTTHWLKKHLHLSNKQIANHLFFSAAIRDKACTQKNNQLVAYKDIIRHELSIKRHVYWLMSIGDQKTDWFGEHSGLKVWYPNAMFDSSIVSNSDHSKVANSVLRTVIAPSTACFSQLKQQVLQQTTPAYCQGFIKNKFIRIHQDKKSLL
jgi:hypothetical protein